MRTVRLVDYTIYETRNGIDLVKNRAYNSGGFYFLGYVSTDGTHISYFAAYPTLEEAENELNVFDFEAARLELNYRLDSSC